MSNWKIYKLSELCTDINYGYTASASENPIGPKFLRITDIVPQRVNWETVPYCEISEKEYTKNKLEKGDIVIARTGGTTGYNYMFKDDFNVVFASYLIRYRINKKIAIPEFINYTLKTDAWKGFVEGIIGGSAQPGANAKMFGEYLINIPPINEQIQISNLFSSLDDKIDLLHLQNKTLEQLAETVFRQWFVEEGGESWQKLSLSSIANFLNGLACQKFPPTNEIDKLPVLKIKELSSGISESSDWASSNIKPEYIVNNGDVIFSWSATLLVKLWEGKDCILNQHLFKVTSKDYPKWFYYLWCKYHLADFISISKSHATTMGHIKRGDLDQATVIVPPNKELKKMSDIFEPLIEKIITNNNQLSNIIQLRDALLPKLMNGEISFSLN